MCIWSMLCCFIWHASRIRIYTLSYLPHWESTLNFRVLFTCFKFSLEFLFFVVCLISNLFQNIIVSLFNCYSEVNNILFHFPHIPFFYEFLIISNISRQSRLLCSNTKWHINRKPAPSMRCIANKSAWVWLSIKFSKLLLLYGLLFFESLSFFRVAYNNFIIIHQVLLSHKNNNKKLWVWVTQKKRAGVKHLYYQKWKNWSICLINVNTRAEYHEYFFSRLRHSFAISSAPKIESIIENFLLFAFLDIVTQVISSHQSHV